MKRALLLLTLFLLSNSPEVAAGDRGQKRKLLNPDRPDGQQQILISPETTVVTEYLTEDGYPDYVAALNARMSEGVTPENNAVVLLWKAIGPRPGGSDYADHLESAKKLGIEPLPETGDYLIDFQTFVGKRLDAEFDEDESQARAEQLAEWEQELSVALSRPWSAAEFPVIHEWIEVNKIPLQWTSETVLKPEYFRPIVFQSGIEGKKLLVEYVLPELLEYRDLARLLVCRAMANLERKDYSAVIRDLSCCHRLAKHVAKGFTLVDGLVAIGIDAYAFTGGYLLAVETATDLSDIRAYSKLVRELGPALGRESFCQKLDSEERMISLDCIVKMAMENTPSRSFIRNNLELKNLSKDLNLVIDFGKTIQYMNGYFDKLATAASEDSVSKRQQKLGYLHDQTKAQLSQTTPLALIPQILTNRKANLGRVLAITLCNEHFLYEPGSNSAVDRNLMKREVLLTALALAEYKAIHGRYPESLEQLVPDIIEEIPQDLFTDKPLIYKTQANRQRMVVYSVGENQIDDRSYTFGEKSGQQTDDLRVRSPEWEFDSEL